MFDNPDIINPCVLLIPGHPSHLAAIVLSALSPYLTGPCWRNRSHLLNHPLINAVPNVLQLRGQFVDYFLLVMVLADAILLGLRRCTVIYMNRKEFKRDPPINSL